jgi:tetratricopeptide (TPR) repeat protein
MAMVHALSSAGDFVLCRCVLELHAIAVSKAESRGEFAVAMAADERARFLKGIKSDYNEYYMMLGTVNAEASDCSRRDDRISIHDSIRSSVGFVLLSRMVFQVLEAWMEEQLRAQAASCDEAEGIDWTRALANVLLDQGKLNEALAMFEKVLEYRRRVLPEDHPDIGEGHVRRDALIALC